MRKSELIAATAKDAGVSRAVAEKVLNNAFENISSALRTGGGVLINGFGSFFVTQRAARTGRNPSTGAAVEIPAKRGVRFKPGKPLRDQLNN